MVLHDYERAKGSSLARPASEVAYLHHFLAVASSFKAALVPHPARWPLMSHIVGRSIWSSDRTYPSPATILSPEPPKARKRDVAALLCEDYDVSPIPTSLVRFGPMPFPLPPGIVKNYDAKVLNSMGTFLYEICVPRKMVDER